MPASCTLVQISLRDISRRDGQGTRRMIKPLSPKSGLIPSHDAIRVTVFAMGQTDPVNGTWTQSPLEIIPIGIHLDRPGLLVVRMDNASMEPIIRRGAYVGIDSHDRALRNGLIYALDIAEEGLNLRRFMRGQGDDGFTMLAENPSLPAQRCPADASGLTIIGKVVWVIQEI